MLARIARLALIPVAALAIALITMTAVAATAGISQSTVTPKTVVAIGPHAILAGVPKGSGVNLAITYGCLAGYGKGGYGYGKGGYGGGKGGYGYPGGGSFGSAAVRDSKGTQGFGSWSPICDGRVHQIAVFVRAFGVAKGSAVFEAGPGVAAAFVCGLDCNLTKRSIQIS